MSNIVLDYVLPKKAEGIIIQANNFKYVENCSFDSYKNAVILPAKQFNDYNVSHGRGGVVDKDGNYIESSMTRARVVGKYDVEEYEFSDQKVVYCGFFHKVWGHFLTEVVSRRWYSLENDSNVDKYVFIDKIDGNTQITGNYFEFFKLLGIEDKIVLLNKPTMFSEVIVPFNGFDYGNYYTDGFINMYKQVNKKGLELFNGKAYDKVFFSKRRQEISIISNLNENLIDKYFRKNGYTILYPERLSLIETIGIMQNAKYFAGISSSLAHNQLFGHENQTMISIEKQAFYNPYQVFVAKITGCKCVFIDACRHIFPVCAGGPFLFDYTDCFEKFTSDYNYKHSKPLSTYQYKKLFKKYLVLYFNMNVEMPPDYMYKQYILDMSREMYNDTIKNGKVFKMTLFERIIVKLKKILLKLLNKYKR